MARLQYPWVWIGIGWLLVIGVCVGSLLPGPVVAVKLSDKLMHFLAYFVLTVWFSGIYRRVSAYLAIALTVIALGALLDVLQGTTATRTFDLRDVLANAIGALVGFIAAWLVLGGWCAHAERWITRRSAL